MLISLSGLASSFEIACACLSCGESLPFLLEGGEPVSSVDVRDEEASPRGGETDMMAAGTKVVELQVE